MLARDEATSQALMGEAARLPDIVLTEVMSPHRNEKVPRLTLKSSLAPAVRP